MIRLTVKLVPKLAWPLQSSREKALDGRIQEYERHARFLLGCDLEQFLASVRLIEHCLDNKPAAIIVGFNIRQKFKDCLVRFARTKCRVLRIVVDDVERSRVERSLKVAPK